MMSNEIQITHTRWKIHMWRYFFDASERTAHLIVVYLQHLDTAAPILDSDAMRRSDYSKQNHCPRWNDNKDTAHFEHSICTKMHRPA